MSGATMPGRVVMEMVAWGTDFIRPGLYLKYWDHEANEGRGNGDFTPNIHEAMTFPSVGEGMEFWKAVSKTRPTRPDGKPNRPLTAFTVTFTTVETPQWWNSLVNKTRNDNGH